MSSIWKKYKKISNLLIIKNLEVYLAENKKGNKVLILYLNSFPIDEDIKEEKSIKIIEIIKKKTEEYIIIEYDPKLLNNPLIGPIYTPFTKEENQILSSKLKYTRCLLLDDQNKETGKIGYFIKFKIKNFPIKKGLYINSFIDIEHEKFINFKYENKNHVINLSSKRKRYYSCKFKYFLIEIINNDCIKDFFVYDEAFDCNCKNKKNFLSKEVVRIIFDEKKYLKSEIFDIKKTDIDIFYDYGKFNDKIELKVNKFDSNITDVILLNLKEKDYPMVGNYLFEYNIIENIKKQIRYSLLSPPPTISIKNIKFIEIKKEVHNYQILNNGNISLLIYKNDNLHLKIYNQNLKLENEIIFKSNNEHAIHKQLNNGNFILLLDNTFIIKLNKESENKYDTIQIFPEEVCGRKDVCQFQDYLVFVLKKLYLEIWKYNTSELKYVFHQKINFFSNYILNCDLKLVHPNELVVTTSCGTVFLEINKNNQISLVSRVKFAFYFCPFIYNKKYLLTENGNYIFDLRKKWLIAYSSLKFNNDCYTEKIILLSNGNLLLEYEDLEKEKKYLIEATIFENEIFVIHTIQLKYQFQLITQLKNGTIVIIKKSH
jgi:hypothetical protein